jgi:hypothetical protein
MHWTHWITAALVLALETGCGRCGGALRGPHTTCTAGPACATPMEAEQQFVLVADFGQVKNYDEWQVQERLLEESGIGPQSWFLVDEQGTVVPSRIHAQQYRRTCGFAPRFRCEASTIFVLIPEAPLELGVHRLVLLVERVHWPLLDDDSLSSWNDEPALVLFYRIEPPVLYEIKPGDRHPTRVTENARVRSKRTW